LFGSQAEQTPDKKKSIGAITTGEKRQIAASAALQDNDNAPD